MSKYSDEELREMAIETLVALEAGDRRGLLVLIGISARTGGRMSPEEIVSNIEALAGVEE